MNTLQLLFHVEMVGGRIYTMGGPSQGYIERRLREDGVDIASIKPLNEYEAEQDRFWSNYWAIRKKEDEAA